MYVEKVKNNGTDYLRLVSNKRITIIKNTLNFSIYTP